MWSNLYQISEVQIWRQMDHCDDSFLSNDWFAVEEAVLYLRIDLLVDDLVRQVGDEEFDIAQ